jgi:hypothetical protein
MRRATLKDLIEADDPEYLEYPPGFDDAAEFARVSALRGPLEALTGYALEMDTGVQDASFFTELSAFDPVPRLLPNGTLVRQSFLTVCFSAFGNFFTIYCTSSERPLPDELHARIATLVSEHGFLYVPPELLDQPHPRFGTWGDRFFSYL